MNGSKNSPDDLHPLDRLHLNGDRLTRAGRKISSHLRKAALFDSAHGVQRQLDGGAGPDFNEAKIARGMTLNPVGFKSANADAAADRSSTTDHTPEPSQKLSSNPAVKGR